MTEQAQQGGPDILVMYRRDVPQAVLAAMGEVAGAAGYGIEFRSTDYSEPAGVEAGETPPVYATLADFRQTAVQLNKVTAEGARAWRVLAREYAWAHGTSQTPPVVFRHMPVEPGRRLEYDAVHEIDVHSLARYVTPINAQIAKLSSWRAKEKLGTLLPHGAGENALAIWNALVKNNLTPQNDL